MWSKYSTSSYLDAGRLADVLTLIQVLAYGPSARRTEDGLTSQLRAPPKSGPSWIQVAASHPEFFRVRTDVEKPIVALVARFVQESSGVTPSGDEKHAPLQPAITNHLMELAVELHDREVTRTRGWLVYTPIIVAITAGFFALAGVFLKTLIGG